MDLLLEVGCEEIPARFIRPALAAMREGLLRQLAAERLDSGGGMEAETLGTPRRLVLKATGLDSRQPDLDEEVLGPKVEAAYDKEGKPSRACLGFARSKGIEPGDLIQIDSPRGKVVGFKRQVAGLPAEKVVPGILESLLAGLPFPKTMRWGEGRFLFARPVHWLVALLDDKVLPFTFAGIQSGNLTRGHRFSSTEPVEISSIEKYSDTLKSLDVVVDPEQRREELMKEAHRIASSSGGRLVPDAALEEEITFLTEKPVPLLGKFDERFLGLPREVLIASMRNHQRYFSIEGDDGALKNAFVAVANTPVPDHDVVRHGFERVLVARLSDAEFFFEVDKKTNPEDLVERLDEMIFQADLGTYREKAARIARLADTLVGSLKSHGDLEDGFEQRVSKASMLCKTDLLTEMVGEFPELQGVMGGVYAAYSGQDGRVAAAVREHYQPRSASDDVPDSDEGALVSLADRLDTLAGCFGVGLRATGTADPYALRRQCLGVISILLQRKYRFPIQWMLKEAVSGVSEKVAEALLRKAREKERKRAARKKQEPKAIEKVEPFAASLVADLETFFAGRLRQRLVENARQDVVDAVLAAGMDDLVQVESRCTALSRFVAHQAFEDLAIAFKRVANIIKDFEGAELDPGLFAEDEERGLHDVFLAVAPRYEHLLQKEDFEGGLELLANELRGPVDRFFDKVLVNDPDDPERQKNRKALLAQIEKLFGRIADFTRLQLKGSN